MSIGYLVTHSDATHWSTMTAQARAAFDPVDDSFTGLGIAQLAFGALDVLAGRRSSSSPGTRRRS